MSEKTIQQIAVEHVASVMAEYNAARQPIPPTPAEELLRKLNIATIAAIVAPEALFAGVNPQAIKHVLREAETVFEVRDGVLVARNERTHPNDPLSPLSVGAWLAQLNRTDGYLFVAVQEGWTH